MSQIDEERRCNKCGHPMTYMQIHDAHTGFATQFVAKMVTGEFAGRYAVTDDCPKCGETLTKQSTSAVTEVRQERRR